MAYLVQGNVRELFQAFEQPWMIKTRDYTQSIDIDLLKTRFLGNADQARNFINTWKTQVDEPYYVPGNVSAGNLFWILGSSKPLIKEDESIQDYEDNFVHQHFAFVNEEQEPCGLMLMYRRDDPKQWVLGVVKNTHLAPERRVVTILSGFDLSPYIKSISPILNITSIDDLKNPLVEQTHSLEIQNVLQQIINTKSGEINLRVARIDHLLRIIQVYNIHNLVQNIIKLEPGRINALRTRLIRLEYLLEASAHTKNIPLDLINPGDFQPELLFADNSVLDVLAEYKISLSTAMLKDCLSKDSGLKQEIESLPLSDDEQVNRNLLQMIILFYEEKVLKEHREFLQKNIFVKTRGGYQWDNAQIQLIPFLLQNKFNWELFTLILSKEFYYRSILTLIQLGYTYDVPKFLAIPEKCRELEYIHHLENEDTRKLCLIFWAKGELTLKDYYKMERATKEYPLLAETLIAIDQTEVTHIKNLKKLALSPLEHQKLSIMHHYADCFGRSTVKDDLKQLDAKELAKLIKSLDVLKKSGIALGEPYVLAAKNNKQGALLRLFLPDFEKLDNDSYRQELVNILYIGIKNGPVTQGKAIRNISDSKLAQIAKNVHERFICAKQMQDLAFNKEVIALAAAEKGIKGGRFRKIISRVEAECKSVQEQLRESKSNYAKITQWQRIDKDYRRILYSIAYDGLTQANMDIQIRINQVEAKVLDIVDPKIESWLYEALITVANILILTLTLGIAHNIKERRTGNYWFFNQTGLGEQIRRVDKDLIQVIDSPAPAPILAF